MKVISLLFIVALLLISNTLQINLKKDTKENMQEGIKYSFKEELDFRNEEQKYCFSIPPTPQKCKGERCHLVYAKNSQGQYVKDNKGRKTLACGADPAFADEKFEVLMNN